MRYRASMGSHFLLRSLGNLGKKVTLPERNRFPSIVFGRIYNFNTLNVEMQCSNFRQPCMAFCTSSKISSASSGSGTVKTTDDVDPTNVTGKKKYWRTYGFNYHDEAEDRADANLVMFSTITLGIVLVGFILAYFPDLHLRDWSQREAYIEIARREALGLPHIDPNLVPPENINLPTDEELGDFEIII